MTQVPMELLLNKIYLSILVNQNQKIVTLLYPGQKKRKTKIEEESGSNSEGVNIKVEQNSFYPALELKKQSLFLTLNNKMNVKEISKTLFGKNRLKISSSWETQINDG